MFYSITSYNSGIEDKLVATDGYGIVVTNEASSFFQEIKGQDVKHDSNMGFSTSYLMGKGTNLLLLE